MIEKLTGTEDEYLNSFVVGLLTPLGVLAVLFITN